jgi:hypothetical protein
MLYSQAHATLEGRLPTFVWLLSTSAEDDVLAYEYRPEACAFLPLEDLELDPIEPPEFGAPAAWLGRQGRQGENVITRFGVPARTPVFTGSFVVLGSFFFVVVSFFMLAP